MPEKRRLIFRSHAVRRMFEREITVSEVQSIIAQGEVIEDDPSDEPYPSRLLMGRVSNRVLHVVAADIPGSDETVIITVYEPGSTRWSADFRVRK